MNFQCVMIMIITVLLCHFVELEARRSSPCHRKCRYVEAFQQADCEDRALNAIPIECNAASYLSLRYNHITTIEPGLFKGFPFLKYLILSNNNISRVEANTFMGAPQLKSIKLLYNNLQVLDRNALNGTENRLRNIYLSRNSLKVIENGTFQLVPRLEVIDLYRNRLTELTSGVFHDLEHLERLFLGRNELVDLPENIFKDLTSLVYLDLSNNSISSLTIDLFLHMNHLKTIVLSGNRLVDIGNVFTLPNIKRLDLRWNRLGQLGDVSLEFLNNSVEALFLEGNPWDCTCSVEPLRIWYQQLSVSNKKDVEFDDPVCSIPIDLVNHTMNSLNVSLCMLDKIKETSTNLPVSPDDAIRTTDPMAGEDQVSSKSETNKANDQIKLAGVLVTIVVIVGVTFVIIIKVVLSKRRLNETTTRKDLESNEQEMQNFSTARKNSAGYDEINEKDSSSRVDKLDESDTNSKQDSPRNKPKMPERSESNELENNDEIDENSPLIDKTRSASHRSPNYGMNSTWSFRNKITPKSTDKSQVEERTKDSKRSRKSLLPELNNAKNT